MSQPPIFTLLSAAASVTAIVGTNPVRVWPGGIIPQDSLLPAICWQVVGGVPDNLLNGRTPVDNQRLQVSCWGKPDDAVTPYDLAEKARYAMELAGYCITPLMSDYDSESKRYRTFFDFSFWVGRDV